MLSDQTIRELLGSRRELSGLCSQNGWIDSETIEYQVIEQSDQRVRLKVSFEEIVTEGSGCIAARIACYGQLDIELGDSIEKAKIIITR